MVSNIDKETSNTNTFKDMFSNHHLNYYDLENEEPF